MTEGNPNGDEKNKGDRTPPETFTFKGAKGKFELPIGVKDEFEQQRKVGYSKGQTDMQEEVSQWKSKYEETTTRLTELEKNQMSAKDLKDLEEREQKEKWDKVNIEKETYLKSIKTGNIKTSIHEALDGFEVFSVKQVENLFRANHEIEVIQNGEEFRAVVKKDGLTISIEEAMKGFLSDEGNSNLLKNKLKPGSGTHKSGNDEQVRTKFIKSEIENDAEVRKAFNEELKKGNSPEVIDE